MKMSKSKTGMILIRTRKIGKSARLLKKMGAWKNCSADIDNRNAASWTMPGRTHNQYLALDWSDLSVAGLEGIAFWITDDQWNSHAVATELQWGKRSVIKLHFNSKKHSVHL